MSALKDSDVKLEPDHFLNESFMKNNDNTTDTNLNKTFLIC